MVLLLGGGREGGREEGWVGGVEVVAECCRGAGARRCLQFLRRSRVMVV